MNQGQYKYVMLSWGESLRDSMVERVEVLVLLPAKRVLRPPRFAAPADAPADNVAMPFSTHRIFTANNANNNVSEFNQTSIQELYRSTSLRGLTIGKVSQVDGPSLA